MSVGCFMLYELYKKSGFIDILKRRIRDDEDCIAALHKLVPEEAELLLSGKIPERERQFSNLDGTYITSDGWHVFHGDFLRANEGRNRGLSHARKSHERNFRREFLVDSLNDGSKYVQITFFQFLIQHAPKYI